MKAVIKNVFKGSILDDVEWCQRETGCGIEYNEDMTELTIYGSAKQVKKFKKLWNGQ